MKKINVVNVAPGTIFSALHFLHNLQMGPNKLECLSLASLSSQVECNSLVYWVHSSVTKKMSCCDPGAEVIHRQDFDRQPHLTDRTND